MKVNIRKAKYSDKNQILKLVEKLYSRSAPQTVKDWKNYYKKSIKSTLVAERNKEIVAYIYYSVRKNSIYIADLYVLQKCRRNGLATKLIKKVENLKKKLKKKHLTVNNRKKDKPAFKLYKNLGFKIYSNKESLKLRK